MAQIIKKFASGGSYGTFTRNGKTYKVNDKLIETIAAASESAANALRQGRNITVNVDSDGNVVVRGIDNNDIGNLNDKQKDKLTRRQRIFEGRKVKQERQGYNNLRDIILPEESTPTSEPDQKKKLDMTELLTIDYAKNNDGSYSYGSSANNKRIKDRLNLYLNNLNGNWDEYLVYKTFANKDAANSYTDSIRGKINDDFWKRLESNTLTNDDLLILNSYGITRKENNGGDDTDNTSSDFNKGGMDYNTYKDRFTYDNGSYKLSDEVLARLLESETGNLWLNDDFKNWATKQGYDASWIPQGTGLFRINGKWFLGSDPSKITGNEGVSYKNWVNDNITNVGGSNNLIKQYWETQNPYHRVDQVDGYSTSFNPTDYYYDRTGQFRRTSNSPLVYDIVTEDLRKDSSNFDQFGHVLQDKVKRVYIDPYTKLPVEFSGTLPEETDQSIQQKYYSSDNKDRQTAFSNYVTFNNKNGKLVDIQTWGSPENNTGYSLLYDPESKRYYWHNQNFKGDNADLNTGIGNISQSAIQIDDRVAQWILNNRENLSDPNLAYYIDRIVGNPFLRGWSWRSDADSQNSAASRYGLSELLRDLETNKYTLYWNGNPVRYNFDNGGNKDLYGGANLARQRRFVIDLDNPISYKHGGIIKCQMGGVLYDTTNTATKKKVTATNKPIRAANKEKVIGDRTDLNAADWAEIAALIGDTAALGTSFVPVYGNAVASGIGMGSSVAGLYSDIKRDGFDWKDLGNFGLNLGLDVATLIPGLGIGAKAAKIARALKASSAVAKVIRSVAIGASALSAGNALITSWDKLQNGNWTIRDIRNIVNGLRGVSNIGKLRDPKVKGEAKTSTVVGKGDKSFTITKDEYDSILSKPKGEQTKAAKELIIEKLKLRPKVTSEELKKVDDATDKPAALVELLKNKGVTKTTDEAAELLKNSKESLPGKINDLIKDQDIDVNVSDYFPTGFSTSSGTWYKPWSYLSKSKVKPIKFGNEERVYLDPKDANWWQVINGKKAAALRDASTMPDNPYFKTYSGYKKIRNADLPVTDRVYSSLAAGESDMPMTTFKLVSAPKRITPLVFGNTLPRLAPEEVDGSPVVNESYYFPTRYQKGGKVIKAQNGINTSGLFTTPSFNSNTPLIFKEGRIMVPQMQKFTLPKLDVNNVLDNYRKQSTLTSKLYEQSPLKASSSTTSSATPQAESSLDGQSTNRFGLRKFNFDIDPKRIADIGEGILGLTGNRLTEYYKNKGAEAAALGSMPSYVPEIYSPYSDYGRKRLYEDIMKGLRQYKSVTSDPTLLAADRLARDQKVEEARKQYYTEESAAQDKFNQQDIEARRAYAGSRTQIADQRRKIMGQLINFQNENRAARIAADIQGVLKPMLTQFRNDITLDQNEKAIALTAKDNIERTARAQEYAKEIVNNGITAYNNMLDKVKNNKEALEEFYSKYGNNAESYANSVLDKSGYWDKLSTWLQSQNAISSYNNAPGRAFRRKPLKSLEGFPLADSINWDVNGFRFSSSTTDKLSKGGTVRYRPYNEQIILDENKEIKKTLRKLDDNLMKLLLKMLS